MKEKDNFSGDNGQSPRGMPACMCSYADRYIQTVRISPRFGRIPEHYGYEGDIKIR